MFLNCKLCIILVLLFPSQVNARPHERDKASLRNTASPYACGQTTWQCPVRMMHKLLADSCRIRNSVIVESETMFDWKWRCWFYLLSPVLVQEESGVPNRKLVIRSTNDLQSIFAKDRSLFVCFNFQTPKDGEHTQSKWLENALREAEGELRDHCGCGRRWHVKKVFEMVGERWPPGPERQMATRLSIWWRERCG